ncbi:hypothetical protein NLJ89_g2185 [Agrocybe chaxingu]|uniref:Major facilitator superfamily (MFS) profile domain-containing protein n=1 Tax=Agrocybe chaxingu TaxID=84603 RepID=A0A9W8K793_9AGAR|nr:hypothetical protein NLJ89_g2185 [Agrocybe chaxingu]
MNHDLHLNIGSRYSILSSIFFIPYVIFQLPSNLFLRRLGGTHWLASLVIAWGSVQLAMGFVPSWGYLALCRVLLGAFEAGFFPAMVYIISTWYRRHEVQKRLAVFYLIGIFIGAFSAVFAAALSLLHGTYGIAGWAWIFIIEGAITIAFGFVAWVFLPGFPDQNAFLTEEETSIVLQRVEKDRGDAVPDALTFEKVVKHLLDWKIWAIGIPPYTPLSFSANYFVKRAGLMYMCAAVPAYAISLFVTIILASMGWSPLQSMLLSAPPYVFTVCQFFFP